MTKPIFILYMPKNTDREEVKRISDQLYPIMKDDYYTLVLESNGANFKTEVYYEKDFNVIKYEQLKSIIENENRN